MDNDNNNGMVHQPDNAEDTTCITVTRPGWETLHQHCGEYGFVHVVFGETSVLMGMEADSERRLKDLVAYVTPEAFGQALLMSLEQMFETLLRLGDVTREVERYQSLIASTVKVVD